MNDQQQSLETLRDIKSIMERSSRFISLSGLSGVSAGLCALAGAWVAQPYITGRKEYIIDGSAALVQALAGSYTILLNTWLFWIALATLVAALSSAFVFTWLRTRRQGLSVWGPATRRVLWNLFLPLLAGGIFLFKLALHQAFTFIAPGCLVFYGLALVNAGKYTLTDIRYLGYCQVLLGLVNLWFTGYGLYFWGMGFGVLHIIYGSIMWYKYERQAETI